jgi:predicted transcriptional regulator
MDDVTVGKTKQTEAEAERQRRLAWEPKRIAEADAHIAAGHLIDEDAMDAWIHSLGRNHELPPPQAFVQYALLSGA